MAGAVEPVVRTTVAQTDNITMVVAPACRILCPHCHTYLPMGRSSKVHIFISIPSTLYLHYLLMQAHLEEFTTHTPTTAPRQPGTALARRGTPTMGAGEEE